MTPACCNGLVQFNTYTAAGARIACWLVNHPEADAPELGRVLAGYDVHDPEPTAAQTRRLRPWVLRLRAVFEAAGIDDKAAQADALLVAANCRPRLVRHGPGLPFHLHYAPERTGLTARVQALTAAGLAHLIDSGHGGRLRACNRDGCPAVFIDTSRNGRRRYCTVRCANQVNVARHRARAVKPAQPKQPARHPQPLYLP
jgi:predicted RNA-binding Zn ribbon-like protein